ncbi:MAG TPA: ATP-binding protein [Ktedonobacteraceae bacterium]|nr:ATP-binding protein [Ktedonobacteraceae bacterium]
MCWGISFKTSLGGKFLLSYLLIVLVGVATLLAVTFALAPTLFQAQLVPILQAHPGTLTTAEASQRILGDFLGTLLIALVLAAVAAIVTSLATSFFVARRITVPLQQMTQISQRISAGHYAERVVVAPVHRADELGRLTASINALAVALEQTERRRLEVIGDVAHELRTPIATLEGYLEGLLDGVVEPTPDTWAMLHTQAGRLRRLVDDLQELSRAEARQIPLSLQPVAPQRLVQSALEPLEGQFAEKGLELHIHLPEDLPQVIADPARAAQILTNVLVNALRYTPAPGKIEIVVSREEDMVAFRVTDTGVGLTPEQLAHIFERFYRVDKSRSRTLGGSGIGLTIAQSLAQAMGGDIRVASAGLGQGSSFILTLPQARE